MSGKKTMACLSGKGHGKKFSENSQKSSKKIFRILQKVSKKLHKIFQKVAKLDGVGPVHNRPSTD